MKKIDFTYTVVGEVCFVDKKDMEMLMARLPELGVEVKTVRTRLPKKVSSKKVKRVKTPRA